MITATQILVDNSRSNSAGGIGTMITRMLAMMPTGKIKSEERARKEPVPAPDAALGGIQSLQRAKRKSLRKANREKAEEGRKLLKRSADVQVDIRGMIRAPGASVART